MSKFTEGKWRVLYFPDILGIVDEDNDPIQLNEANARLIAAAPEMYQHLKLILNGEFSSDDVEQLIARIDGEKQENDDAR